MICFTSGFQFTQNLFKTFLIVVLDEAFVSQALLFKEHLPLFFFFFFGTQEQNMAAMKIQAVVRRFLWKHRTKRQNRAAVVIQAVWRGYAARDRLRLQKEARRVALQHKAATMIQVRVNTVLTCMLHILYTHSQACLCFVLN